MAISFSGSERSIKEWKGSLVGPSFSVLSFAAAVLLFEVFLRGIGFSFQPYPKRVEFGFPSPIEFDWYFEPDRDLIYVPKGYQSSLRRIERDKPEIVFMGDSCTDGQYAKEIFRLSDGLMQREGWRYASVGVPGWSSYQGVQQLKRDIAPLKPKVVTAYFGWNDHWYGFGIQDKEVARIQSKSFKFLLSSRVVQLILKGFVYSRLIEKNPFPARVPLSQFRQNLIEMIRIARRSGIVLVLLTAPSSHERGREPAYLSKRWLKDLSSLVPVHEEYVNSVKSVASEEGVPCCDLYSKFRKLRAEDPDFSSYFYQDGIHLTPKGNHRLAEVIYDCLASYKLIPGRG